MSNRNNRGHQAPVPASMPEPAPVVGDDGEPSASDLLPQEEAPVEAGDQAPDSKPDFSQPQKASEKTVIPVKKGIEVRALRAGLYKGSRKVEGDVFFISDMSKLGSWMKCVDPKIEVKHQEIMKAKKDAGK